MGAKQKNEDKEMNCMLNLREYDSEELKEKILEIINFEYKGACLKKEDKKMLNCKLANAKNKQELEEIHKTANVLYYNLFKNKDGLII